MTLREYAGIVHKAGGGIIDLQMQVADRQARWPAGVLHSRRAED